MALTCSIQPRNTSLVLIACAITTLVSIATLIVVVAMPRPTCSVPPTIAIAEGPAIQYASSVRAFSTEYSGTNWAAVEALGPPDVYPHSGDEAHAWASRDPDASTEFIELGFAQPQRTNALLVYETFNPGAITSVELITESGKHLVVQRTSHERSGGAAVATFGTTCTTERVVATRLTVASGKVAGWNEVDAVGLLPCP